MHICPLCHTLLHPNRNPLKLRQSLALTDVAAEEEIYVDVTRQAPENLLRARFNAAETEMIRAGADLALAPRADGEAGAVLICAQERSAPLHFFRLCWLSRVVRGGRSLWISSQSAGGGELLVVVGAIPVARPLPDITGHIV